MNFAMDLVFNDVFVLIAAVVDIKLLDPFVQCCGTDA